MPQVSLFQVCLAVCRAEVDASDTFEQAAAYLSPREVFSILTAVLSAVL
ncbi:hypothetical protein [Bradyrhizobium pachyrhizi]